MAHVLRHTEVFSSVQLLSRVRLFAIPWTAARQASLSITNSQSSLQLMSIESVMPSNHLILCCPLLLSPSILPSFRVFSKESVLCIRWPKYWSFSFNISSSNEYSGLISFRMDCCIGSHFLNPRFCSISCKRGWIILFFCSLNIPIVPPQTPPHWSLRGPGRTGLDLCVSFFTTRWNSQDFHVATSWVASGQGVAWHLRLLGYSPSASRAPQSNTGS